MDDEDYMRRAMALGRRNPGSPIGCVIVLGGLIVGEGHNEVEGRHDPTAHAEVVAMRRACELLKVQDLEGAVLYSTLQPCGMCTMASIWAGIRRIVFGAGREDVHEMYFEDRHLGTMDFIRDAYRSDLSIEGGVLTEECASMYYRPGDDPPIDEQANL
jgi:tRNA(adenine34) deaminase